MSNNKLLIPPLCEYLAGIGVTENTPLEQVVFHKSQYRKLYQKVYAVQRRRRTVRLEIQLSKAQHRKLKQFASRYKRKKLSPFLRDCALAYLEEEYVEHEAVLMKELKQQIRAIGHNVNQVVHQLHYRKDYANKAAYQHLKGQINELHNQLDAFMKKPPKIREILEKLFTEVPQSIEDFERFLEVMKAKHQGDDYQKHE